MAETAIIYGNRYRPVNKDLASGLSKTENIFFKGNFKTALESAIEALNIIDLNYVEDLRRIFKIVIV